MCTYLTSSCLRRHPQTPLAAALASFCNTRRHLRRQRQIVAACRRHPQTSADIRRHTAFALPSYLFLPPLIPFPPWLLPVGCVELPVEAELPVGTTGTLGVDLGAGKSARQELSATSAQAGNLRESIVASKKYFCTMHLASLCRKLEPNRRQDFLA